MAKATDATDATGLWEAATSDANKQIFNWFSSDKTLSNDETKNLDNEYLFVIPQNFETGPDELYVVVKYTIKYNSGSAKPTVSYNVYKKLEKNFLQGKAYMINLTIGLTPIEFEADVTKWDESDKGYDITWN